jgi:lambda repressor-like predicted transcriptional regulator
MLSRALDVLEERGLGMGDLAKRCRLSSETVRTIIAADDRPTISSEN